MNEKALAFNLDLPLDLVTLESHRTQFFARSLFSRKKEVRGEKTFVISVYKHYFPYWNDIGTLHTLKVIALSMALILLQIIVGCPCSLFDRSQDVYRANDCLFILISITPPQEEMIV